MHVKTDSDNIRACGFNRMSFLKNGTRQKTEEKTTMEHTKHWVSRWWNAGSRVFRVFILCVGICILSGCGTEAVANKVSFTVVAENKMSADEIAALVEEIQKQEEVSETVEIEEPEIQEKSVENKVTSNTKSNNTNTTNNNISSKYPYYIKVNRLANCVTIYKQDTNGNYTVPVKAMICSVGKNINNTPAGVFKTSDKYTWRYLFGDQYGQYATRITGHILFHSVPYTSQARNTLKTDYYNNLGIGDSMGCIRLTCADAKWIYDNCPKGTTVEIYDSADPGPLGKPTAMKIDMNSPYAGWDPTDPDGANPWRTAKPTISGVTNISVTQGVEVDYLSNVSAVDVYGVVLNVNTNGSVDINTCGEYVITYTATDARGNIATETAVITVVEPVESEDNSGEVNEENEYGQ